MNDMPVTTIDHSTGDRAVKWWFVSAAIWFPLFTLFGFLMAVKFFWPTFLSESFWDTFGRIRPAALHAMVGIGHNFQKP